MRRAETMRWVSMVPSWTETLLECGADVVGRTRFCIHPRLRVASIPAIGGTKEMDLSQLENLKPDLLLLDREENPRAMAEQTTVAVHASHVRSVRDLSMELLALAQIASSCKDAKLADALAQIARRWDRVNAAIGSGPPKKTWATMPGLIEWLTPAPLGAVGDLEEISQVVYTIWKSPWMCAAEGTFISSVLHAVGINQHQIFSPPHRNLYPPFDLPQIPQGSVILFSSEPYPFVKKKRDLQDELLKLAQERQFSLALVDGESFSWFGIRTLKFLETTFALTV